MNKNDIADFREIFDREMFKEGFIWRYQTYIHVNFEQYWFLAIWPKVFCGGDVFNIAFRLSFFHEYADIVKSLKQLHVGQLQEMFVKFVFFSPIRRVLPNSKPFYQLAFDRYNRFAKNIVHDIQTVSDACMFQKEYLISLPGSTNHVPYEWGEQLIQMLLLIHNKQEALSLISLMRNTVVFMLDSLDEYENHHMLKWPNDYLQLKRDIEIKRQFERNNMLRIDDLEQKILSGDYKEMVNATQEKLILSANNLRKR